MDSVLRKVVDIGFDKKIEPSTFLANFYEVEELDTLEVEIHGRSVKNTYSVDVELGTGGRKVEMGSFDRKSFVVPEYNDYTVITEKDLAKINFGQSPYDVSTARLADMILYRQSIISLMHRNAEEKQASDGLFYGQIAWSDGTKIELNKKGSHSIGVTNKWGSSDSDPDADIENACKIAITDGSLSDSQFNLIMESSVWSAYKSNEKVKNSSNWNNGIKRTDINMPEEKTPGAFFHGQKSCGSYTINLWTYEKAYEIPKGFGFDNEGKKQTYIPKGGALLLPMKPEFKRYYGAINDTNVKSNIPGALLNLMKRQQVPYAYDVLKKGSAFIEVGVKSRPLLIPCDMDCFVTFKDLT